MVSSARPSREIRASVGDPGKTRHRLITTRHIIIKPTQKEAPCPNRPPAN
jgi:hypothetical protein